MMAIMCHFGYNEHGGYRDTKAMHGYVEVEAGILEDFASMQSGRQRHALPSYLLMLGTPFDTSCTQQRIMYLFLAGLPMHSMH